MITLVDALLGQRPCSCCCHDTLRPDERVEGVRALYVCDDALRGHGYVPDYELHGDALWREAQRRGDPAYRGVAVRFGECVHRRLLGSLLHELIHASQGETSQANYGVPYGLPYGVPDDVDAPDEEAFLAPFNQAEARAFVGVWILGRAMFGIDWNLRTARDVGTYGFLGGNALVSVPRGYRPVAHVDRQHHAERYYARARRLEAEATAWFDPANVEALARGILSAASRGAASRPRTYPDPEAVGRLVPRKIGRNEPCTCGSARKYKSCCGAGGPATYLAPTLSR